MAQAVVCPSGDTQGLLHAPGPHFPHLGIGDWGVGSWEVQGRHVQTVRPPHLKHVGGSAPASAPACPLVHASVHAHFFLDHVVLADADFLN